MKNTKHLIGRVWSSLHRCEARILQEGNGEYLVILSDHRLSSPQWISARYLKELA